MQNSLLSLFGQEAVFSVLFAMYIYRQNMKASQ